MGETGKRGKIPAKLKPLKIQAAGRGTRQVCRVDQYGFPRTSAKTHKRVSGFQTGDMVKAIVPDGKKKGTYCGKVAIRTSPRLKSVVSGAGKFYEYQNFLQCYLADHNHSHRK